MYAEEVLLDVAIDALCQGEKPKGDKKPPMVYTLPPLQVPAPPSPCASEVVQLKQYREGEREKETDMKREGERECL